MGENPQIFGNLLSEGIRVLAACENKPISVIEDELGYAIGRRGGSAIGRYRRGHIPPKSEDIERLAGVLVQRGHMPQDWLYSFLESAGYRFVEELVQELLLIPFRPVDSHLNLPLVHKPGLAPPVPPLVIGREDAIGELKGRLLAKRNTENGTLQILTAVRGWPGVGKTTLACVLAHDDDVSRCLPDGVLWVSLGPTPDILSQLISWGLALGNEGLARVKNLEEAHHLLSAMLRQKRFLLIIDDVWKPEHARPFMIGGLDCATLITTRLSSVAHIIAPTSEHVYCLPVLSDESALTLLTRIAPTVVRDYSQDVAELIHELEGLPLAIQVAGRLLHIESQYGFGIKDLLDELRLGARLLEAQAPTDRSMIFLETTPTVAALLQKSTDCLDEITREHFALLGVFAPKPATFDLEAIKYMWQTEDPKPTIRALVDRGLLETVTGNGRFQMHALLVRHADSLFRKI